MLHIHACYKHMFQCFRYLHTSVASILSRCCIAMANKCFSSVLQVFQTYVASISAVFERMLQVSSGCCKSRSDVAHVAMGPIVAATCCSHWVTSGRYGPALGCYQAGANGRVRNQAQAWGPCVGARKKTDGAGSSTTPQRR
jgi:hypothetical protein